MLAFIIYLENESINKRWYVLEIKSLNKASKEDDKIIPKKTE
jgi:hypothetical protein